MKYIAPFAAVVVLALAPFLSFAQTSSTSTQPITVATVNIYDTKIVSQQGNIFTISFNLSNRQGAQPGVRYAVELVDAQQNVADEYVYPAVLNLNPNTTLPITAEYTAPSYLSGAYQMLLLSSDTNGLPLAEVPLGTVTLTGSGANVAIEPSSCYLQVGGAGQHYSLQQGIDITPSESLVLTCSVQNNSSSTLSLQPTFETFYRTEFGSPVNATSSAQGPLSLSATGQKDISLTLPKPAQAQAYDVQVSFSDTKNIPSNSVLVHYVLDGASATIQNVTLDNTSYRAGSTAEVILFWTGGANDFPDARSAPVSLEGAQALVHIVDSNGNSCGQDVSTPLQTSGSQQTIPFAISASCVSPVVTVTLSDASGTVLASSSFQFTAPAGPSALEEFSIVAGLVILFLIFGYFALRTRGTRAAMHVLFFAVAGSALFLSGLPGHALADTYSQNVYVDSSGNWSGWYTVNYTVNLDNDTYAPGAPITASGSAVVGGCDNSLYSGIQATINGQSQQVYAVGISGLNSINDPVYTTTVGSAVFTAQTTPGTYNASFYAQLNTPQVGNGSNSYFCLPSGTNGNFQVTQPSTLYYSAETEVAWEQYENGGGLICYDDNTSDPTVGQPVGGTTQGMTSFDASDPYNIPYTVTSGVVTATLTANGVHNLTVYPDVGSPTLNYNYTVTWSSTGASACTLSYNRTDGQSPTTGSNSVPPSGGSGQTGLIGSYTLTCTNDYGGSASDTDIITAAYPSCSVTFDQNPFSGSTTMNWTSTNAATLSINNVGAVPDSGSQTVSTAGDYTGTVTSPGNTTTTCPATLTAGSSSTTATCPDGSAAPNGNPSECTCAQGNTAACSTGTGTTCPNGSAAPGGNPAECTCAQGNTAACSTGTGTTCPNGTQAPNGDPTECSCSQGNLNACTSGMCPDGSAAPSGNVDECSCSQGNVSACGGGGGGSCAQGEYLENGSCVASCSVGYSQQSGACTFQGCPQGYTQQGEQCVLTSCPLGYQQESGQCVFTSCPQGYTEQTGPTGTPECSVNTCSVGPICSNGNAYIQNADCSLSNEQVCSWGCSNGQCLLPPPPSIATWQVKPVLLQSGQTTTVTWQATDVASCSVTGSNGDSWTGDSGTKTSSPITGQTVYTILCQGEPGSTPPSATDSTTVNIVPNFCETGAPGCP